MNVQGHGTTATAIRSNVTDGPINLTWFAYDVDQDTRTAPVVIDKIRTVAKNLRGSGPGYAVLSSQLPVGTCAMLEAEFDYLTWAVIPENLRANRAVTDFSSQPRIVIGTRSDDLYETLDAMLWPFTQRILRVTPESAEFSKHALNCMLAVQIAFGQQVGEIAVENGADPDEVAECLRSDPRIGQAYIGPAGDVSPHLRREVDLMRSLGKMPLLDGVA